MSRPAAAHPPASPAATSPPNTSAGAGAGSRGDLGSLAAQERRSFGYAFQGLRYAWLTQRHLRVHAALALLATGAGLVLGISPGEWAALLAVIALVGALEMLNTVVEVVVDMITTRVHPQAKVAKDLAAGAVLLAAMGAVAVGAAIFLPRIWRLVSP